MFKMKTDLVVTGYIISNDKVLLTHHNKLGIWLPVGGHVENNETLDDALKREVMEETNLGIEILNQSSISVEGNVKRNLASPFYVNVHSVGDHDHCSLFYVCKVINHEQLSLNKELRAYRWFSREELNGDIVPVDVRNQALKALELYKKLA